MKNRNSLNRNVKEKLDQHEFQFNPKAWDNMEALLDGKGTPNKSIFKTKTIIIMTTVFFILAYLLMQQPDVGSPQSAVHSPQSAVSSPQSTVHSPQSIVGSRQSAVGSRQSVVRSPQSIVGSRQSTVSSRQSVVRSPQSIVGSRQSAVSSPQSVVRSPQSIVGSRQSAVSSPQSVVRSPQSIVGSRQSAVGSRQAVANLQLATNDMQPSTVHRPQSTVSCLPFFEKLTQKLATYNDHYTYEKIYLQFDRMFFEPGESVWFNAFVRDANTLQASPKSEILYVELLAPNGSVAQEITLLAKNGTAAGDFQLDKNASGGMYKIRAYTNWQRNTDDAFERDIQVQASVLPRLRMELDFMREAYGAGDRVEAKIDLNTLANEPLSNFDFVAKASLDGQQFTEVKGQTDGGGRSYIQFDLSKKLATNDGLLNILIEYNGQTESISRSIPIVLNKIDLQFMPEGGDFVAGLPAVVAFKALNEFGKPADVEGYIANANGQRINDFRSYHQGMGIFEMTPEKGIAHTAHIIKPEGISEVYPLPAALERGYALHVNHLEKKELAVEVNSTEAEELHLALVSRGEIYFTQTIPARAGSHFIKIPTATLPIGTAQLTLFDSKEMPRAERLVFLNPDKKLDVEITTDKEKYLPREKVKMTIRVTDERGMPMPGQFSLSIADDNLLTFADDKQGHILSYLLLESDLTGEVVEPNFYFDKKEKHPEKDQLLALDYLMLTQGWRRFNWEEVLWEQPVAMEFQHEEAKIQGQVVDVLGDPMVGVQVNLMGVGTPAVTDENGNFSMDTLTAGIPFFTINGHGDPDGSRIYSELKNGRYILQAQYQSLRYEDLPVAIANSRISKNKKTTLTGSIYDLETDEPLLFANVILYKNGKLVTGTNTDIDGDYVIGNVLPGTYDVEFNYVGYQNLRVSNVPIYENKLNMLGGKLDASGVELMEVAVTGLGIERGKQICRNGNPKNYSQR